jgi:hypothetical protein
VPRCDHRQLRLAAAEADGAKRLRGGEASSVNVALTSPAAASAAPSASRSEADEDLRPSGMACRKRTT